MASLTLTDARVRADLIDVEHYDLRLDLTGGSDTFRSRSQIRFRTDRPGATVLLDVQPRELHEVRLNGRSLDVDALRDGRFELPDLRTENVVVVEATMAYSHTGEGLHRAVDPADDESYVYGMAFLEAAPRIFACFDQPDLKAPYDVAVRVPGGWSVFGNGATQEPDAEGLVRLATTPPLATYFVTVVAGPWATVRDEHDGIPLSLSARASQRAQLEAQAPQMLEVTRQSFDYFHALFGIRYPFGDYDQVFVPEFNAGAMENPGCVVHNDVLIFRGEATRAELLSRSNTIAHEMAHMWFGDLVTMRWWDDLWLNESFAEYMSHRALAEATEFTEAFVQFGIGRKARGYRVDASPSTHPIAGAPAPDAESALQNFDGISYAKGASVLRQLIAHLGDAAFIAGVRDHLTTHRFGNADLADFLGAMERAAGRDLATWQQAWLRIPGADTISVELDLDDGFVRAARLHRDAPPEWPADRSHTMDVAGYEGSAQVLRVDLQVDAAERDVPELVDRAAPMLLVPNAADLTWAEIGLDDRTLDALPDRLAEVPSASARAVVWTALQSGIARSRVDPRQVVRTFRAAMPHEPVATILGAVSGWLPEAVDAYLPEPESLWARGELAAAGLDALAARSPSADDHPLTAARLVARTTTDTDLLARWLGGDGLPGALADDAELRWAIADGLARYDALDADTLARLTDADRTMSGHLHAIRARTLRPTAEAKAAAWESLTCDETLSNHEQQAYAEAFWDRAPVDVVRDYRRRYFIDVPRLADRVTGFALLLVAVDAFPRTLVEQETLTAAEEALAQDDLHPAVRRAIVDRSHEVACALASRAAFMGQPR